MGPVPAGDHGARGPGVPAAGGGRLPLPGGSGAIGAGEALRESAGRLLAGLDLRAFSPAAWEAVEAAGLPAAILPEEHGGFGVEQADALSLLRLAGAHAAALPVAGTMLGGWMLAAAGLDVPPGPMAVPQGLQAEVSGGLVRGVAWGAAFARHCDHLVLLVEGAVALVPVQACTLEPGMDVAGDPLDVLRFEARCDMRAAPFGAEVLRAAAAGMHGCMMAGAVEAVLDMTVAYANERVQFGKPIGRFQAVQQSLAVLAGHAAAARAAADAAAEAWPAPLPQAVAKVRAGEAAGAAAAIAHQVHGAIGFTEEYRLHRWTRRLWAWRDAWGHEAEWSRVLGRHMAQAGADRLWRELVAL